MVWLSTKAPEKLEKMCTAPPVTERCGSDTATFEPSPLIATAQPKEPVAEAFGEGDMSLAEAAKATLEPPPEEPRRLKTYVQFGMLPTRPAIAAEPPLDESAMACGHSDVVALSGAGTARAARAFCSVQAVALVPRTLAA